MHQLLLLFFYYSTPFCYCSSRCHPVVEKDHLNYSWPSGSSWKEETLPLHFLRLPAGRRLSLAVHLQLIQLALWFRLFDIFITFRLLNIRGKRSAKQSEQVALSLSLSRSSFKFIYLIASSLWLLFWLVQQRSGVEAGNAIIYWIMVSAKNETAINPIALMQKIITWAFNTAITLFCNVCSSR